MGSLYHCGLIHRVFVYAIMPVRNVAVFRHHALDRALFRLRGRMNADFYQDLLMGRYSMLLAAVEAACGILSAPLAPGVNTSPHRVRHYLIRYDARRISSRMMRRVIRGAAKSTGR